LPEISDIDQPPVPGPEKELPPQEVVHLRGRALRILWIAFRICSSYFIYSAGSTLLSRNRAARWKAALHQKNAVRLQQTALSLKGLLIKVCQFMSARVDLLPEAYTHTLSLLQDQVPPAPYAAIRARLIDELGAPPETIFERFNEIPLASASLGQVHEAILKEPIKEVGGTRVAVKVQYPEIEAIVETDLKAIRWISWFLQKVFTNIRFDVLYSEFSKIVHQELNYIVEARQAEQFQKNFSDDPRIVVPRVIWPYTTQRILTLQFVEGIKISRLDEIRAAGIDTKAVAKLLVESYMKQILQHKFFHGDPHPGNLFVQPGPRLVFVDFGLMQQISAQMHRGMEKMIIAVIDRDIPGIAHALLDLGFIARSEKIQDIENVVYFFMDRYRDISPRSFRKITLTQIAQDLETLFHVYPSLQVPNHFILVGRTAGMLNGLCSQLDPDLNIIELAKPYAKQFIASPDWGLQFFTKGKELLSAMLDLPVALRTFLDLANSGQFRTRMNSEDLTGILTKIYRLGYRTVLAGFIVTMFFLYSNLVRSFDSPEGILLSALIALPLMALIFSFVKGGK
jgi:predicted unusual protein kinase regulating ubiquinone biosynthesis (AarF/ABC1/UbiB family)